MYTEKKDGIFDSTSELALTSNAVIKKFTLARSMYLRQIALVVTTAMNSTGAAVVQVKKYPAAGSSANAVLLGSLSIPAAAVGGQVYYKDIPAVKLLPGQELVFEVTTASTTAGKGICLFDADDNPERPANVSMIASA